MGLFYNKDEFYYRCIGFELVFVILPKRCFISEKLIWFEHAYRGTVVYTGPGDPILESFYHKKEEHLLWLIKK